ncbi:HAAS signaling domain-containing protein [Gracilibacillus sp. D59]|uniref:HAAS signaling domain-containing protein n=1 Tax=Gracilibacillus sp. D59 TaxID=3457434 RepID=UPI003FCDBE60
MEMIDRYIYAVTQKLPQSQREDIAEELHSLIEDMLDERVQSKNITDDDVEEVLMELGNPRLLAQKYRGTKKYLIGPEFFDSYMLVLKIALISTFSVILLTFVIKSVINPVSILDHFVEFIVALVTALPAAVGWTTFGFAIPDHFGEIKSKDLEIGMEWKPSDLAPIPDKKRQIKYCEPLVGIAFYTLLIIMFVFSNEYLGIWIFHDGFSGVVPFLNSETYSSSLLFIILIMGIGIIKESLKLVYGKWTYKLVINTALVNLVSIIAVFMMINGNAFWNPDFMLELTQAGLITENSDGYRTVSVIWEQSTLWIVVLLVIGLIWDVVDGLIKANKK